MKRKVKSKGEKERYPHVNAEFQRIARRDKKAFLSDQCKEIEENNRMGKTRDLFKKIRYTKGIFHAKMGSIKDRNGMDLTEAEDIKKRWRVSAFRWAGRSGRLEGLSGRAASSRASSGGGGWRGGKGGIGLLSSACGTAPGREGEGGNQRWWACHSSGWGCVPSACRRNYDEYDSSPSSGGWSGGSGGGPPLRLHPQDRGRTSGRVLQGRSFTN